jgi:hypothetical protein
VKARRIIGIGAVALSIALIAATAAGAATSAPKWEIAAASGPTNLPPTQSEVQRLTVEAEGGSFTLQRKSGEGKGTPVTTTGNGLSVTNGSATATILAGTFEVGERITTTTANTIPPDTTVLSCSPACSGAGSTLTLSKAAAATNTHLTVTPYTLKMSGVSTTSGSLHVGDLITGAGIAPETTITELSGTTLKASKPTTSAYTSGEVSFSASERTAPVPFDASAEELQSALNALPAFAAGSFIVTGGPGGDAGTPLFIAFGGSLAQQDVEQFSANGEALTGNPHYAQLFTTVPGGAGTGEIGIYPANLGPVPTGIGAVVHIGPLPAGIVISGAVRGAQTYQTSWSCTQSATEAECTAGGSAKALGLVDAIGVPVKVTTPIPFEASTPVTISGAGAGSASYTLPLVVSTEAAKPGAAAFWGGAFTADGEPAHQAGSHPSSAATYFVINTVRSPAGQIVASGLAKDIAIDIPPGFTGNPMVTERCPQSEIACGHINGKSASVGRLEVSSTIALGGSTPPAEFSNDVPAFGMPAEFTTKIFAPTQALLLSLRSEEDFGVRVLAPHAASNLQKIFKSYAVLYGSPEGSEGRPFFTLQSDCAEEARKQAILKASFDTWQEPGNYFYAEAPQPPVTGCDKLRFEGYDPKSEEGQVKFSLQPTTTKGSSPAGAEAHLHIDQSGLTDPNALATPPLKRSVVKLPAGLSLNPSQANGLEACSEAQVGYKGPGALPNPTRFDNSPVTCPEGSKLGTVEAVSPLLESPLKGTIYLAAQEANPFDSLIGIYLVIESPRFGITIKLPGRVDPDPATGQLTATFDYNPQQAVEDLTLRLRGGGPRSEMATPEVCGTYTTSGSWEPWSAPESGPPAQTEDSFEVREGCAGSAAGRRFEQSFEAGTTGTQAGGYAPLVIKVNRNDGEQELKSLDFTLPPGLTGKLAGIATCSDDAIKAAEGKSGRTERSSPSCPTSSQLGTVDTAAGVGSEPFHAQGKAYLTGPYKGAPLSSVVITPAVAGPFDLGNVVVRAPLYVNPETAQLTAKSDPIPAILKGIPLKVRSVAINVDRSQFILNPTNCEAMKVTASIAGSSGATATPRNRFQVGGCDKLEFGPKLKLALKGGTRRNGNPALTATLTQPAGQANIGKVQVALPHSEFLDQSHIRTVCTRVQFAASQCPQGAIYGQAEAITPLLDQPLTGPVYLRSSSNKLPDLVVALKGPASQPIEVVLDGRVDSIHGGIRNTFELVPDAPVSKFVLRMQGGKRGLLVNSRNLCATRSRANVQFTGQNGKSASQSPLLQNQCAKKHKKHKKQKKHSKRKRLSKLIATW